MIRDPSDGSVREPKKSAPDRIAPQNTAERLPSSDAAVSGADTLIEATTSGLPDAKAKDADRHKRSREWLADYRAGKFKPKSEEQS